MPIKKRELSEQGFALIVVAALFVAFAMIAAAMIDRSNATKQQGTIDRTQTQLSRLSEALIRYSIDNNKRYPCPASPKLATTSGSFGVAITTCATSLDPSLEALNAGVVRGMVPVAELLIYGISPNDAFDSWGNRIMYVVDRQLTPAGTGTASATRPYVTDTTNSVTTTYNAPDYILVSYGRDGMGAYARNNTTISVACSGGTEMRTENCNADANFFVRPITTGPGLTSAQYFDDVLAFYGRTSVCSSPTWVSGLWGSCSVSCGDGTQSRTVKCVGSDNITDCGDPACATAGAKPATSQNCNNGACCTSQNVGYNMAGPLTCVNTSTIQYAGYDVATRNCDGTCSKAGAGCVVGQWYNPMGYRPPWATQDRNCGDPNTTFAYKTGALNSNCDCQ